MSRRATGVLWFGLGILAAQPLAVGCVLAAEWFQRRSLR